MSTTLVKKTADNTMDDSQINAELAVKHIWSELLLTQEISSDSDFFALGGNSILVLKAVAKMAKVLKIDIPHNILFIYPTFSKLCEWLSKTIIEKDKIASLIPIQHTKSNIPLSFAQQRLWFLEQALEEKSVYNIPLVFLLTGSLNHTLLQKAFSALFNRHETLRASVQDNDGVPELIINGDKELSIQTLDLSNFPTGKKEDEMNRLINEEATKPFDLSKGPLIRVTLINLSQGKAVLIVNTHHIIFDGWSIEIFCRDLSILYNAYLKGEDPHLPELGIKYGDFILWQREWLQGDVLNKSLSYWEENLKGVHELNFPTDKKRPKIPTHQKGICKSFISSEVLDALHKTSKKETTTLFMTLLTAFNVLLHRYTSQDDIVIGTPFSNRHYSGIEETIGFFVNTLPLRVRLTDSISFIELLHHVRDVVASAYENQDLPFDKLVDQLKIPRDINKNPLFQILFGFNKGRDNAELNLDGTQNELIALESGFSHFDLVFNVYEEDGLHLVCEYAKDLFEEGTIKQFLNHFKILLKGLIKNPYQGIRDYPLLTQQEQHQILVDWNDTATSYPEEKPIHQLFEEQVNKTPNNTAVVYEDQELTYKQLNQRANQLAHYLRKKEVGPDTLVAIAVERSLEMVIGLLGILKTGGAYVPLDPSYPSERLQFMLEDTAAPVLITQVHLKGIFKDYSGERVTLSIDAETTELFVEEASLDIVSSSQIWTSLSTESSQNLTSISSAQNLAYVIYTSGSTGKPKGIENTHYGLVNRLLWTLEHYPLSEQDAFLYIASLSFDISIWEMLFPLLAGASVVVPSENQKKDILSLINLINAHQITIFHLVPSLLSIFIESKEFQKCQSLTQIITGGETLSNELRQTFISHFKDTNLYLAYGPSEAAISVTHWNCRTQGYLTKTPIGRPISNTQIYILDSQMNPVPIGVSGEIHIGGTGLARGYLNRPDLTAERFIPNPFVQEENPLGSKDLRLYRTGDLARYLPDGNIEFLGRIDDQVKIRGFRIELGEIESTLSVHGEVAQAVVIAREDEPGDKKLVAYVVPHQDTLQSLTPESTFTSSSGELLFTLKGEGIPGLTEGLRNHLIRSLPDYMVPSFFVYVDQIPLTPNGKIDRKVLPAPDLTMRQVGDKYIAPQTEIECELVSIWTEVLKVEKIGIHDNFFRIGGHSLLATQVISRIRHTYHIDIPLRALFEQPTIAALSQTVDSLAKEKTLSLIPPLVPMERSEFIPLSFAQTRLWFLDQLLPDVALYNISLALNLTGNLNQDALEKALNTLIERHESLRTIFPSAEGEAHQVILDMCQINLEECSQDLSHLKKEERSSACEQIAFKEANTPFNLSVGPLMRVRLVIFSTEDHALFITLHHIISDGWSMNIFFRELSHLYNAYMAGELSSLPKLPIQYADFALWQRKWLQGDALENQLSYWKQQLSGIPDLLDLPSDKPRPKELTYHGASYHSSFSQEIKDKLNELAQDHQVSLFMTLLAAFQVLLYRYTGQRDIVVGSPIANRHTRETEDLIGFFVNTLALRTTFEGNETFIDVLLKVKETTLQAYQHQDVYFDQLIDHLNVPRVLNKNPVFQVEFSLESLTHDEDFPLNDLSIEPICLENSFSKFDLRVLGIETKEGLLLSIDYATDLFEEKTIERLAVHLKALLGSILKNPSRCISELCLLSPTEENQLLIEWNDTKSSYPEDKLIHQLFEEQAKKTPDNIAVVYEDHELTYQQLNEKANQLAHYLRSLGVGSDTLVALAVERSLEMIIGLLGILKTGGAYVPLDPSYPSERLQFMLEDTNVPVLITDIETVDKLPSTWAQIICLDEEWESIKNLPITNLASITSPQHLAYVIYTSGSTGKPKGVMIGHKGMSNLIKAQSKIFEVNDCTRALQFASCAFDASISEIFTALTKGAALFLIDKETLLSTLLLEDFANRHKINLATLPPSFLTTLSKTQLADLKTLVIAGESSSTHITELWSKDRRFINAYGPTEGTICSSFFLHREGYSSGVIGRPISNTQIHILDPQMNPVPVGITGEIYIGGVGLARGYLNRPDLTADRFIPNPFVEVGRSRARDERREKTTPGERTLSTLSHNLSADNLDSDFIKRSPYDDHLEPHSLRLYRTRDLARYLPDGNIEFLGRIDDQVKIRGFRIELGEIESTLHGHRDVSQVVIMAREDDPDNKKLVAYVVPLEERLTSLTVESTFSSSGISFSVLNGEDLSALTEDLRNHLARSLPDYMIPSFFVYIDKIPLTPNGKIDRKVLPAPDLSLRLVGDEYVAPQSQIEQELASIWAEVLKVEKIGIHDNFFRIGGDSIVSIQMVSKARSKGIYFTVKDVFNHPTVSGLASVSKTQESSLTFKPDQGVILGEVPLTPIQHFFFEQNLHHKNHYNQSTLLQASKKLNSSLLNQLFSILLSHHDALRLRYHQDAEGKWSQTSLAETEPFSLQEIDLSHIVSEDQLSLAIEEQASFAQQSLNITKGPLLKTVLFDCGSSRPQRLLIVIHHLAVDGVSWRILLEDLETGYTQLSQGETPSLPSKTHSYQQWANTLKSHASSQSLLEEISYWKQIRESVRPLPVDFNYGPPTGESSRTIAVSLTENETTQLLHHVPKAYRTEINDILLTALVLAIGDWTKTYALTLSLEGHGREEIIKDIDLSRTVGWFTSLFPIHLNINNHNDLAEAIKTVKETLRQIPDKGIRYGILEYLTEGTHFPSSQQSVDSVSKSTPTLSFNYLGQWDNTLTPTGVFTFAQESAGQSVSDKNAFSHFLDINSEVRQGVLQLFWSYSSNHYKEQTIGRLTHTFIERLKQIIQHCCQEENFGYTPSDFRLAHLTQSNLDTSFRDIPHIEHIYLLSPMQSGLLFQTLYAPGSDAYFVQSVFELEGELDVSALKSAWQKVSDNHPILRTGFVWEGLETPLQYVLESAEVPFAVEDWQRKADQAKKLQTFIQEDRKKSFDLSKAPLFRLALIHCAADKHYLIWSQHHILTDGWSTPIILGDVFKAYEALRQGRDVHFKPSRPYRDYIAWLQKQNLDEAEAFWKETLASLEAPTKLSFKNMIKENKEKDYETYSITFSHEETEEIKRFAQDHELTLNTVLQGAVGLVLQTYTQQQEVVMGVTVSGRNIDLPGVEEMVGLFINTLPLKITSHHTEDSITFLKNLQNQTQKLNEYAYTPLAQIQSWSGINQSLFDVIFVFENYPLDEEGLSPIHDFSIKGVQGVEKTEYPLTLVVGPGRQLYLSLNYQTEHFNEELIKKLSSHIKQALYNILHNSKESPQTLPLLTQQEKHQLLVEWNDTATSYPEDKKIHQLFEEQVAKSPYNVAVVYEDRELTYEQLNKRANQLAHHLRSLGVGPDTLVAIAVERSLEMIIGLLGILKAGGAYVPLDPSYPQDRLQFMLQDTSASILITQDHLRESFKDYTGKTLSLQLDTKTTDLFIKESSSNTKTPESEKWISSSPHSSENPTPLTTPHHLAYIIYTSGSTGKPKGVMINHQGVSNRLMWMQNKYELTSVDRIVQKTPFTFDVSVWEFFWPLIVGSIEVIASPQDHKDPDALLKLMHKERISVCHFVPSMLEGFLNTDKLQNQPSLKLTITSGEALSHELAKKYYLKLDTPLHNLYGPTEASIDVTFYDCDRDRNTSIIPIGCPISNTQIYILDPQMNPVPVGVRGEIYIGGVGLARGYLNRPDLTAEKFIPNPFISEGKTQEGKSLRLYRTGDLARYLPDGNIEFLGRMDDQVKIRGFRIELGEIESALHGHGDVSQVVVMARDDDPNNKKLVAYIVPHEERVLSLTVESTLSSSSGISFSVLNGEDLSALTEDLRNHLAQSLPDHMIPSFFVYVDRLPLTPNGKIDRKALLVVNVSVNKNANFIDPFNHVQLSLINIWKEVLKTEEIGINHNFFEIGGNSIVAIKAVARIQQFLSKKISVADIFKNPTIYSLSTLLEYSSTKPFESPPIIPIREGDEDPTLFLIHPGGGLAFCYTGLARYIDTPIYGINNPHFTNPENGFNSIEEMAAHYIKLIKEIQKTGPYYLGGWSIGGLVALEMSHQLSLQQEKVKRLILIDVGNPKKPSSTPQKNQKYAQEITISPEEKGFILPQELKDLIERNLKTWEVQYIAPKYKGDVFLLRAENKNKLGETINHQTNSHGWKGYIKQLKVLDIPGEHISLFDHKYIKSTAEVIRLILALPTIEKTTGEGGRKTS